MSKKKKADKLAQPRKGGQRGARGASPKQPIGLPGMEIITSPDLEVPKPSNHAVISHDKHGFVINFLFADPARKSIEMGKGKPFQAHTVAKVYLNSSFLLDFIRSVELNWEKYEKSMLDRDGFERFLKWEKEQGQLVEKTAPPGDGETP